MPGYERTPFMSSMALFQEQPPIAAFIRTETAQNIPNNVNTPLTFATPINEDGLNLGAWQTVWDPATPGQFTIGVRGFYLFGGSVVLDAFTANNFSLNIRLNGGLIIAEQRVNNMTADLGALSITTMHGLGVGTTIELMVLQDSGAGVNTLVPTGFRPNMWIIRVR
jgi:hypothetical protein